MAKDYIGHTANQTTKVRPSVGAILASDQLQNDLRAIFGRDAVGAALMKNGHIVSKIMGLTDEIITAKFTGMSVDTLAESKAELATIIRDEYARCIGLGHGPVPGPYVSGEMANRVSGVLESAVDQAIGAGRSR